ncbi:hypothetical protein PACTADRAFT_34239 [Pachysolen tannophilus NRRL Y-2460]|uniref:Acyl-protein thioesterase 1 n=1 Tax=Pachysolen tannophilus NRRL Y-2460 TaxID=669874 RepID=A0A1E4TV94_PACTA|nr:hypothetical protein PACTADRAFT_34239 [Pachysolen tannophilus NRRL Y-2460]
MVYSALRIPSKKVPATAVVILLHGLGDTGAGWKFLADYAHNSFGDKFQHVKFVFPHAPEMPVTVNGGYRMTSWFDLFELGNPSASSKQDIKGFLKCIDIIKGLIQEQIDEGINPNKILLGGFSQGAALTLASAALLDNKIGGFLAMSGFVNIPNVVKELIKNANVDTPILQCHGTADPVVNYNVGEQTYDFYKKNLGFTDYIFKTYPGMGHSTCDEELNDIFKFFEKILI